MSAAASASTTRNLTTSGQTRTATTRGGYPIKAEEMMLGTNCKLDYCGDMAAICRDCLATHEIVVREKSKD